MAHTVAVGGEAGSGGSRYTVRAVMRMGWDRRRFRRACLAAVPPGLEQGTDAEREDEDEADQAPARGREDAHGHGDATNLPAGPWLRQDAPRRGRATLQARNATGDPPTPGTILPPMHSPAPRHVPRLLCLLALLGGPACGRRPALAVESAPGPADAFAESADPALAVDPGTGDLLASFVARGPGRPWQVYVTRSADGGSSWTTLRQVSMADSGLKPQGEASPRLVAGPGGRLAVVWVEEYRVPGRRWAASRLRASRSADGGRTWSRAVTLNDDTTAADPAGAHLFHGAAWQGDSGLVVAWLDERRPAAFAAEQARTAADPGSAEEADATIYSVSSTDFGATWGPNQARWPAACPCCRVTLAREPGGSVAGAWRQHFPGDVRDVVLARLPAGAGAAPAPARVHEDGWVYPGCPYTGPALAVGDDGARHVAWYTGRPGGAGVFLARAGAPPLALVTDSLLPSAHAALLPLAGGATLAAWDIAADGSRRISAAHVTGAATAVRGVAVPGSDGGMQPQLAALGAGGAYLAWTRVTDGSRRVAGARLRFPP